jgi:hypothetical protein
MARPKSGRDPNRHRTKRQGKVILNLTLDLAAERQKWVHFGSILSHYQAKRA